MIKQIAELPGVVHVDCDQCAYGLVAEDADGVAPAFKPTGWLANSRMIAAEGKANTAILLSKLSEMIIEGVDPEDRGPVRIS